MKTEKSISHYQERINHTIPWRMWGVPFSAMTGIGSDSSEATLMLMAVLAKTLNWY